VLWLSPGLIPVDAIPRTAPAPALLSRALGAAIAAVLLSACGSAPIRPAPPDPASGHAWQSTCTVVCSDGSTRTITARIVADGAPPDGPCEYGGAAVRSQACGATAGESRDCGSCTAWVEAR